MKKILKAIATIKKHNYYPDMPVISSPHRPKLIVNGEEVMMFASNNYLGMMTDERVIAASIEGTKKWGIGNGGSRVLTGNLEIHGELEKEIAELKGKEAALTFVTGYMVNEGCIPAIANVLDVSLLSKIGIKRQKSETVIFSDEYNHASIVAGVRLAKADTEIYKHNDMGDLEEKLKKYSKNTRKLIVSDGVFSMDGDIVDLPNLVALAKKYNAMTYIDDAHSTGILGKNGRGTEDHFDMDGSADFVMGTFTKAFGGVGGYITGDQEVVDYLKISAKTSIFTAPIAPPIACGLIESVKIVKKEPWRREKIVENAKYMRGRLKENGFDTMLSETQIIPVLIGDEKKAVELSKFLFEKKIFAPIVRWPAVPKKQARLRLTSMVEHEKEHIDFLIENLIEAKKKLKF